MMKVLEQISYECDPAAASQCHDLAVCRAVSHSFEICSISVLVQDSLRYLVQDSLAAFTQLILDACFMVQDLPADLDWGSDIINSPYK